MFTEVSSCSLYCNEDVTPTTMEEHASMSINYLAAHKISHFQWIPHNVTLIRRFISLGEPWLPGHLLLLASMHLNCVAGAECFFESYVSVWVVPTDASYGRVDPVLLLVTRSLHLHHHNTTRALLPIYALVLSGNYKLAIFPLGFIEIASLHYLAVTTLSLLCVLFSRVLNMQTAVANLLYQ